MRPRTRRRWFLVALAAVAVAALALPSCRALLWRRELNPVLRGRLLTERLGCQACHLPPLSGEIPNPGSRWGTVPRFSAGNASMYVRGRQQVEELIRFGAPRAWLDDPAIAQRLANQHIRMPAYGDILRDEEVSDLVALLGVLENVEPPGTPDTLPGRQLARQHGCLSCHGIEGAGGRSNPRSLGGFIPGFLGDNFSDLVQDEAEFREWVLSGTSRRLEANPAVRFFWRRQQVSMPAYEGILEDREVEELWRWIQGTRHSFAEGPEGR